MSEHTVESKNATKGFGEISVPTENEDETVNSA